MTKKLLDSIIIFRFDKIKIAKEELYVQKKKKKSIWEVDVDHC